MTMSSVPVVLRLKRKLAAATSSDEEAPLPAIRLLSAGDGAKRPRADAALRGQAPPHIFVFAGRVATSEAALAETAVRRAIGKRKLDGEADRLRRRLGERPSEGEGRLVYKRRRKAEPTPVRPVAAAAGDAAAGGADCRFRIVDFEAGGGGDEQIACNGVAMAITAATTALAKGEEEEGGVCYDVYYGYSCEDLSAASASSGSQADGQLRYLLQAYEEAYHYGDDCDDDDGFAVVAADDDDDSDSNSESNWRNEYPDTPPSSAVDSDDDDVVDDVDPYDDEREGAGAALADRLGSACVLSASPLPSPVDAEAEDDWRDWREFRRQLLEQPSPSASSQQQPLAAEAAAAAAASSGSTAAAT